MRSSRILGVVFLLLGAWVGLSSQAEERSDQPDLFRRHFILTEDDFELEYRVGTEEKKALKMMKPH